MAINERQYMAARLAELRDIAKRQKNIENLLGDILEILKINTYGESNKGVQLSLDDICDNIIKKHEDVNADD